MMEVKQVIVMRTDLGMRKGKMIAQGAHASIAFLTNKLRPVLTGIGQNPELRLEEVKLSEAEFAWLTGRFTKICVRVDSEEELLEIYEKAKKVGVMVHLITDAGLTEFGGVPTKTCLAIGPDYAPGIDLVTGHLKLL